MTLLSAGDITLMHTVLAETSNARLTRIEAPGSLDAYNEPSTRVSLWSGSAVAFLESKDHDVLSMGAQVRDRRTTLLIFDAAGAPLGSLVTGSDYEASTILVEDRRVTPAITRRWTVTGIERDVDGTLSNVLLTINDERSAT